VRVAVAAPHPDDFDVIAVTLRWFHDLGASLELAVLTRGHSGVENGFGGAHAEEEKAALREVEQRASCAAFGLEPSRVAFLRLAEDARGHPLLDAGNTTAVRAFLGRADPDIIFLPHGRDSNTAHQRTHTLVTGIVAENRRTALLCLAEDPKTLGIRRDMVMPFDEPAAAWKAQLLRCHASQQERNLRMRGIGLDERILGMNRKTAEDLGIAAPYAESFELACYEDGELR